MRFSGVLHLPKKAKAELGDGVLEVDGCVFVLYMWETLRPFDVLAVYGEIEEEDYAFWASLCRDAREPRIVIGSLDGLL